MTLRGLALPFQVVQVTRLTVLSCCLLATSAASPKSLDGFWRSEGYGYVFEIKGAALNAFEVTTTTCVPGLSAQRQRTLTTGREATFKSRDDGVFSFVLAEPMTTR